MTGNMRHKHIRLRYYDYSKAGAYFITICTGNKAELFGDIELGRNQSERIVEAHPCVRPNDAYRMIEKWLFKLQDRFEDVRLDYYVIMPDHIHFVLFLHCVDSGAHTGAPLQVIGDAQKAVSLYDIIKWFKTQTTNEYIKRVKIGEFPAFNKRIWQRGYYDHVVRSRDELHQIRKYIRDNPARRFYNLTPTQRTNQ